MPAAPGNKPDFRSPLYRLSVLEDYIQLWNRFFRFFAETQNDIVANPRTEDEFLVVLRDLAYKVYSVGELCAEHFGDAGRILKLLTETKSLAGLKTMPELSFDKLQIEWHEIFLNLNKARGRMVRALPPKLHAEYKGMGGTTYHGAAA